MACQGTARMMTSAPTAASEGDMAPAAPVDRTTFPAPPGFLDPKTTSCRGDRAAAKPRPILPVPMMAILTAARP